jgi:O-antigen ligase
MKTAIKFFLWILTLVPLVVDMNVFYPYTSGKNLLIESCLVLAGIFVLINFFYSREYKEEIIEKATKYIRNPLVISLFAFISIFIISTIFAVDKSAAFWGNLSRAEGLAGTLFFFSFFVFSLLTFEKKDWLWFFKLSLFASLILLGKEFTEYFSGAVRPGSFTGNPTFLAGYLLFSITSGLIVLGEIKSVFFKYLSVITIILSVVGIFIAETRGTILGLGLGIITALIYSAFKGGDINYKKFNLRKVAITFLCLGIVFSGVFFVTRENEVWQKMPGLSRLAVIGNGNTEDISTPVRLYLYKSSIASVNPAQNGWSKFLIGWGPDNFIIAESQNYNPALYNIESDWHDRAHNKFLDVLVMNGLLGLIAYLVIWVLLFRYIIRQKEFSLTNAGLLVFATAYLTHLMFIFDTISTTVPFFLALSFAVYLTTLNTVKEPKRPQITPKSRERDEILAGSFLVILTLFLGYIFFINTLPGYIQMRNYTSLVKNAYPDTFESKIDSVFSLFTTAQMNIRRDFLSITNDQYNKTPNDVSLSLLKKAITKTEEYVSLRPMDFQFMVTLGDFYTRKGFILKDNNYLKKGEELLKKISVFSPDRPDINIKIALNFIYQGLYEKSFYLYEKTFEGNLLVVGSDRKDFEIVYTSLIKYFYEQKDKENFIKVADRLKANNYDGSASLDKILDYLDAKGVWPKVDFK